jgi:hypothetical protein
MICKTEAYNILKSLHHLISFKQSLIHIAILFLFFFTKKLCLAFIGNIVYIEIEQNRELTSV